MKELIFQIALYTYLGLAVIYGFWAILQFGAKNTMLIEARGRSTSPDWLTGLHFFCQSVAFYLLYFATKDLPINTNAFSFVVRMWWAGSFVTALAISLWYYGKIAVDQWLESRRKRGGDNG